MRPRSGAVLEKAITTGVQFTERSRFFLPLARFPWNLRAFLASFRESNRDRLLARSHFAAFSALAGIKRAALFPVHCTLHAFTCSLSVFPSRTFFCWHFLPSCRLD